MAVDLREASLPALNDLLFTDPQRSQMFELARSSWRNNFDPDEVATLVTTPAIGRNKIGVIRKHGLVLRTAYRFLDEGAGFPPAHRALVSSLGQVRDRLNSGSGVEQLVWQATGENLNHAPVSDEVFVSKVVETRTKVSQTAKKREVPTREFHGMRKYMRHFMNLFALSARSTGDPDSQQLWDYLKEVNDELGDTHDQLVFQDRLGIISYEDTLVPIDQLTQGAIVRFLESFK